MKHLRVTAMDRRLARISEAMPDSLYKDWRRPYQITIEVDHELKKPEYEKIREAGFNVVRYEPEAEVHLYVLEDRN
ncbi:MAG: hypothetical protein MPK62_00585 [Alphaproteobacteria bacterium]|nr:hypothetical protein [Alphaproteobacteria bacterium]MDA8029634.1 hypothetical protein [Alphaproteobacteria bacterium]